MWVQHPHVDNTEDLSQYDPCCWMDCKMPTLTFISSFVLFICLFILVVVVNLYVGDGSHQVSPFSNACQWINPVCISISGKRSNGDHTACVDCEAGYSCSDASTAMTPCNPGYYQDGTGGSTCVQCPAGSQCPSTTALPANCGAGNVFFFLQQRCKISQYTYLLIVNKYIMSDFSKHVL